MGIPLAGDFDVAVTKPVDSRMVWTGTINDLNNIPNKYKGLTCYITGNKNLYIYQDNNIWEEIVKTNIDYVDVNTTVFNLDNSHDGKVLYVNNNSNVNIFLPNTNISNGYNTTIVQMGSGSVIFNNSENFTFSNILGATGTAGRYAVTSLLKLNNLNLFLLYGDVAFPSSSVSVNQGGGGVGGFNTLDFPVYTLFNRYMSGCWPYPLDLVVNQKRWRETLPFNRIFNVGSALATSADGKYQTAVTLNRNINPVTLAYDLTDGYILSSSNSGANWNITNPFSDNFISVAMNSDGQYQTVLTSSCRWGTQDIDLSTLCPNTGLKILNSNDYGNTWSVSNFPQFTGVWSKILMNDLGNMRVVISEKTAHLLFSYDSGVTWSNLAPPQQQLAYNNVSMSKDGKYLIALTNKSQANNSSSRIWISNNSGQTWINDYPYQPIHFEPYRVRTTGIAATLKTGEALYKYNGIGQVSEIYLHKYNLDGEPTVWNSSIQPYLATANDGLNIYQWVTIRSKSNPNQQYRGRYIFPLLPGENAPDTIRIPFQDFTFNAQDPQLVFNNDNSIYYISPQGGFGAFDSYSMDCAAISNDGRVQAIIDPHTTTNFWSTSSVNYNYPGICISHDYGLTWRAIAYRNRGLFTDTGYCNDVQGYSVPSYDLAIDGSGKNLFLNNFFYSENSGISWTNRKVGRISLLGRSWIPSNIKISNDGKVVTMTEQVRYSSSNKIYNIDNFFQETVQNTAPAPPNQLTATQIVGDSFVVNWNAVIGATSYRIDVSTNNLFTSFVGVYNNLTVNETSLLITGLTANTTYYIRVRAVNNIGSSTNSPTLTQAAQVLVPSAPNQPTTSNVTNTSFTVNWNLVNNATSYRLDIATANTFNSNEFVGIYNNLLVNGTSQNVTGLLPNATYWARVRASNIYGTSSNSQFIGRDTAPSPPDILMSGTANRVTWNPVPGALNYQIDIATDPNFTNLIVNSEVVSASPYPPIAQPQFSSAGIRYIRVRSVANFQTISNNSQTLVFDSSEGRITAFYREPNTFGLFRTPSFGNLPSLSWSFDNVIAYPDLLNASCTDPDLCAFYNGITYDQGPIPQLFTWTAYGSASVMRNAASWDGPFPSYIIRDFNYNHNVGLAVVAPNIQQQYSIYRARPQRALGGFNESFTWDLMTGIPGGGSPYVCRSGEFCIVIGGGGIYKSYNSGTTWVSGNLNISNGAHTVRNYDTNQNVGGVLPPEHAISSNNGAINFAISENGKYQAFRHASGSGAFISNNYGTTFNYAQFTGTNLSTLPNFSIFNRKSSYIKMSACGRFLLCLVGLGSQNTSLMSSRDYGNTWNLITPLSNIPSSEANFGNLAISRNGRYQALAYAGRNLWMSTSNGSTWFTTESARTWRDIDIS